jgi:hypothetical protein
VIEVLKAKLAPTRGVAHRSSNTEAYNQYLLGKRFQGRGRRRLAAGNRRFPQSDRTRSRLSRGLCQSCSLEVRPRSFDRRCSGHMQAMANAERAVTLAPQEADGYASRGVLATARKIGIEAFRLTDVAMAEHSLVTRRSPSKLSPS